jgi:hypothetical protein
MYSNIYKSFKKLRNYCESEDFKGWDPYDGLNSQLFQSLPFVKNNTFARLLWIQFFKKSAINLRKFLLVAKGYNPKGLALFLSGYCNLYKIEPDNTVLERINWLANKIIEMKSSGFSGACWGYNFDWQSRLFFNLSFRQLLLLQHLLAMRFSMHMKSQKKKNINCKL